MGLSCEEAQVPEWSHENLMAYEKEALGFYLTSHPLKAFQRDLRRMGIRALQDCRGMAAGVEVKVAAVITTRKEIITKKGDRMAFMGLADMSGEAEGIFFPESFLKLRELLGGDLPLLITAKINGSGQGESEGDPPAKVKLDVQDAKPLTQAVQSGEEPVEVRVEAASCPRLAGLTEIFHRYPGQAAVHLRLCFEEVECLVGLPEELCVGPCPDFWREVDECLAGPAAIAS